jgi:hypothetical protein
LRCQRLRRKKTEFYEPQGVVQRSFLERNTHNYLRVSGYTGGDNNNVIPLEHRSSALSDLRKVEFFKEPHYVTHRVRQQQRICPVPLYHGSTGYRIGTSRPSLDFLHNAMKSLYYASELIELVRNVSISNKEKNHFIRDMYLFLKILRPDVQRRGSLYSVISNSFAAYLRIERNTRAQRAQPKAVISISPYGPG